MKTTHNLIEMTEADYASLTRRSMDRKQNGPIKIHEMTETERAAFTIDIESIRKRGMYR